MIKMQLSEVWAAKSALEKLAQLELPIKEAYKISKILRTIQQDLEFIEQERAKLIKKYAKQEDNKNEIKVAEENVQDFLNDFYKILEHSVEYDFVKINLNNIGDSIKLTATDILMLSPFIDDISDENEKNKTS